MTTRGGPELLPESLELSYDRTIDRALVHKAAVSEVFITDVQPVAELTVSAGAHLPIVHSYFSDHTQDPAVHDALLILEAGRQAAISGTHVHLGFAEDTITIVDRFTLTLDRLKERLVGQSAGQLRIDSQFVPPNTRSGNGRYRKGRVEQRFLMKGEQIGEHIMHVNFLKPHQNDVLRRAQRGTPAPLTSEYSNGGRSRERSRAVEPERVARAHPMNVVLSHASTDAGQVSADVTPSFHHRSLFDHVYDHIPAMTLVEAARQLAMLSTGQPRSAHVVGIEAGFSRFAELDDAVTATTPAAGPVPASGPVTLPVSFQQGGAEIASVAVTVGSLP